MSTDWIQPGVTAVYWHEGRNGGNGELYYGKVMNRGKRDVKVDMGDRVAERFNLNTAVTGVGTEHSALVRRGGSMWDPRTLLLHPDDTRVADAEANRKRSAARNKLRAAHAAFQKVTEDNAELGLDELGDLMKAAFDWHMYAMSRMTAAEREAFDEALVEGRIA